MFGKLDKSSIKPLKSSACAVYMCVCVEEKKMMRDKETKVEKREREREEETARERKTERERHSQRHTKPEEEKKNNHTTRQPKVSMFFFRQIKKIKNNF